jgi:hypothetical protein
MPQYDRFHESFAEEFVPVPVLAHPEVFTAVGKVLLCVGVEKFNPNHDEKGEFSSGGFTSEELKEVSSRAWSSTARSQPAMGGRKSPRPIGVLDESLIGDGTYGGSSMSRLSVASIRRIAGRAGIDPEPYLSIKAGPAGARTGRNKLEQAILYVDRQKSSWPLPYDKMVKSVTVCPKCGERKPAAAQTCESCSAPGTGDPEVSTQGIESTPDETNPTTRPGNLPAPESIGSKKFDDPQVTSPLSGAGDVGVSAADNAKTAASDRSEDPYGVGVEDEDEEIRAGKEMTTAAVKGTLLCALEKFNPNHDPSDGEFSSGGGSNSASEKAIVKTGFAQKVHLGDIDDWRAKSIVRAVEKLRKDYPKAPAIKELSVSSDMPEDLAGRHTSWGGIEINRDLFKTGGMQGPGASAVLYHEYGHHLDEIYSQRGSHSIPSPGQKIIENPHRLLVNKVFADKENWTLTKYAKTSPGEMVAEAFMAHTSGRDLTGGLKPLKSIFADWKSGKTVSDKVVTKAAPADHECRYPMSAVEEAATIVSTDPEAVITEKAVEGTLLFKFNPNHGPDGKFAESPFETGITLKPAASSVFHGDPVPLKTGASKLGTGELGEKIAIQYARQYIPGCKKASPLRPGKSTADSDPVDIIADHKLVESKAGLVSNSKGAQQWVAKIGRPSKAYLALKTAAEKKIFNDRLRQAILFRKTNLVKQASKATGSKYTGLTVATIINTDTKTADVYVFSGFHGNIGWQNPTAKESYRGSYQYK